MKRRKKKSLVENSSTMQPGEAIHLLTPTQLHVLTWTIHGLTLTLHRCRENGDVTISVINKHGEVVIPES